MEKIKIEVLVKVPIEKVWEAWNSPEQIKNWAFASDTWECPSATNDLRVGGKFNTRMSAKDGTAAFDFTGTYLEVDEFRKIKYIMDKGEGEVVARECEVFFEDLGDGNVRVVEVFDPENENPVEMQKAGWQEILNNFKKFVEHN